MNFAASKDIIQNTPFPYNSMDRLRLAQQMTQAPQVSQEVQGQGGLAGLPVVQAGFGGFLRKIAPIALAIAAPYVAAPLLGTTVAAMGPVATGFAVGAGSGLGSLIAGARPKDALKTALLSGVTAGAAKGASNYFAGKAAEGATTSGLTPDSYTDYLSKAPSSEVLTSQAQAPTITLGPELSAYAPTPTAVGTGTTSNLFDASGTFQGFDFGTPIAEGTASGLSGTAAAPVASSQYIQTNVPSSTFTPPAGGDIYSVQPGVEADAFIKGTGNVYTGGGEGFTGTSQEFLKGQTTPGIGDALKGGYQQFVSDIKTKPLQMLGKAAVIDMTQPDFERMYKMEELSQQERDLMASYPTATISGYGTKKVVNTPMGAIPYTSDTASLERALQVAYGRAPRTRQLPTKQYQDVNVAAEGGLITAARGGMFAAPGEFSGMVPGQGGGQDDNVFMPIVENGQQKATLAVSPSEYVVDSYTMAALGDGNPAQGAKVMDQVVEEVREEAYGTDKQPNATKGLSTLRSLMT
jgi:hypothetical protein